jgi:glycylpeptide N-tetradecanoyltransferase
MCLRISPPPTLHLCAAQEITRRVNLHDIWQAVYTAGVLLPRPVAECQYWHRSLNPKKLIAVGFSR